MINIVIPMGGKSIFFDESFRFPKALIEIDGRPMLDRVLAYLKKIKADKRFIFIVNEEDITQFHLDDVIKLLTGQTSIVISKKRDTKGAVCSALLAVEHFDSSDPLIICNSDSIIDSNINEILAGFEKNKADAGTICFDSVHPQWSYVLTDSKSWVLEAAEKHPISTHAIAGFYYFKQGSDFVKAAFDCIEKESSINGLYYTSLTFNQLILAGRKVKMHKIPNSSYHSFYSPEKIRLYEKHLLESK